MSTPDADASRADWADAILQLRAAGPDATREVCRNYRIAANVLTYNWIEGNPRADWEGKPFDWYPTPPHFRDWHDRIRRDPLNMFLAARKHTKTTFADTLMIHRSEYEAGHQSLYWANTQEQVAERMEELEEIVDANPWLEHVHTNNALKRKQFDNGSRILTTWVQGAFEGGHVDLMLGDDPMKEFADIPDARIEAWYGRVIVPTINVEGEMALIGTRKRPTDLYELLRQKHEQQAYEYGDDLPRYSLTEYPAVREAWEAEYDRPGDLAPKALYTQRSAPDLARALELDTDRPHILWPEARPPEWLKRNLGGQGRSYFLREFCMIFRQAEDAIVQRAWIARHTSPDAPPSDLTHKWTPTDYPEPVTRGDFDRVVTGIDPAGKGRDRFAFVTLGILSHDGRTLRHVLDAWQQQDVPPSKFRQKLTSLFDRYEPDVMALESNLNQTWVADDDEIPSRVRRVLEPIATGRSKHSWKDGVPRLGSDIEAGHYRFYDGAMTDDLITALTSVQRHEGELVGHTPDLVMAMYMCHKALGNVGRASSTRSNLQAGPPSPEQERREQTAREKRAALRESDIGRAILDNMDSGGL